MADLRTGHAVAILQRFIKASPNPKAKKALDHLRARLGELGELEMVRETNRCEITTRASDDDAGADRDDDQEDQQGMYDTMIDDETIEASIRASTAGELVNCPPAVPLPRQAAIVDEAIAAARAAGLQLPATINIRWREGRPGICRGATTTDGLTMFLSVNVGPDELLEVAFHELQHVADFASGTPLTRVALEQRALAFGARMMGER